MPNAHCWLTSDESVKTPLCLNYCNWSSDF